MLRVNVGNWVLSMMLELEHYLRQGSHCDRPNLASGKPSFIL